MRSRSLSLDGSREPRTDENRRISNTVYQTDPWTAPNSAVGEKSRWREAWTSVHHDGSVTLASAVGKHPYGPDTHFEGWEIESRAIECSIADFTALIRATAATLHHEEYEVRVGTAWAGKEPLSILTVDGLGFTYDGVSTPIRAFTSVRSTIDASASTAELHRQVHELAQDCINQGGLTQLLVIKELPAIDN